MSKERYTDNDLLMLKGLYHVSIAKQYFEMLEKQLVDSLTSEQIQNSKFYEITDKETGEVTGLQSCFVLDKDCDNYTTVKISYDFRYKSNFDKKDNKFHDTGVIDYFEIKMIITNLEGINFSCKRFIE